MESRVETQFTLFYHSQQARSVAVMSPAGWRALESFQGKWKPVHVKNATAEERLSDIVDPSIEGARLFCNWRIPMAGPSNALVRFLETLSRVVFGAIATILLLLALVLAGNAVVQFGRAAFFGGDVTVAAGSGIGYVVESVATLKSRAT